MLKKAGIVVATAAAGLLAVSPLAFAGDSGHGHDGGDHQNYSKNADGLVNLSGNNVNVPIQACHNQVPVNVLGVQVPLNNTDLAALDGLTGALGLLGDADADSGDSTVTQDDSCNQSGSAGDSTSQDD
ncbi:hypothetical protein [Pseudonocardia sp. TRM90224]|uniref:hypothetical protein n=1 Tax=Pseudonocardia sp. TRM90224 TaxID=2812678 RepID=UPI001E5F1646|nr:hypothetical protein [Pseudonocardia sp. TRM90224]